MLFGYMTLATALILSLSAAIYSILGLTAIFAAAFWPIVILGGSLEIGKIVTVLWLHKYWKQAEIQYKLYLSSAVVVLMVLTSMGVFGFLSKAHLDQAVPSGDVQAQVQIFDDKIRTQKDNIEAARKALSQMDAAVDQTMSRSSSEQGADKAANLRRSQSRERTALQNDISKAQKEITGLQEQRAPAASAARKIDAEVGPIKYIAALIYGDNPDTNVLERAVRWVIILIVVVFDPLALTLLLAATKAFEWEQGINVFTTKRKDNPLEDRSKEDFDAINKLLKDAEEKEQVDNILQQGIANSNAENNQPLAEKKLRWSGFAFPMLSIFSKKEEPEPETVEQLVIDNHIDEPIKKEDLEKESMRRWKEENPSNTIKRQEKLKELGAINDVPWHSPKYNMGLQADNEPHGPTGEVKGFGTSFPVESNKGDMFLRVDQLPTQLYKFNGIQWIVVDKGLTDNYAYDDAYIDHLIDKIDSGEYDLDLLSDTERDAIEAKLKR
jgi:hypothetical protein